MVWREGARFHWCRLHVLFGPVPYCSSLHPGPQVELPCGLIMVALLSPVLPLGNVGNTGLDDAFVVHSTSVLV